MSDSLNLRDNDSPTSFGGPSLYRHSGRVPAKGMLVAAAILIPLGIVIGIAYSAAVVYLPYVKLRGLVTFLTGAILGVIAGKLCYSQKYRNRTLTALTIVGFTTVAYYSSWAVHMPFVVGFDELGKGVIPIMIQGFDPRLIIAWATYIFEEGIWSEGDGKPVAGWFAVTIWVIEAGFIYVTAFLAGLNAYGKRPYCEQCDRWNEETEDLAVLPVSMTDPIWAQVRAGDLSSIRKLQITPDPDGTYVELRLADCPTCDHSDYLSAIGITLTMDDGQLKKNETDIFRFMSVSRSQRDEIVEFATELAAAVEEMQSEVEATEAESADEQESDG